MFCWHERNFHRPGNVVAASAEKFKTHRSAPRWEAAAEHLNARAVKREGENASLDGPLYVHGFVYAFVYPSVHSVCVSSFLSFLISELSFIVLLFCSVR